jgi:hypothetical protein
LRDLWVDGVEWWLLGHLFLLGIWWLTHHGSQLLLLGLLLVASDLTEEVVLLRLLLLLDFWGVLLKDAWESAVLLLLWGNLVGNLDSTIAIGSDDSVLLVLNWILRICLLGLEHVLGCLLEALNGLMRSTIAWNQYLMETVLGYGSAGLPSESRDVDLLGVQRLVLADLALGVHLSQLLVEVRCAIVTLHLLELERLSVVGSDHLELVVLGLLLDHLLLMGLLLVYHAVELPLELLLLHVLRHWGLIKLVDSRDLPTTGLHLLLLLLGKQLLH